VAGLIVLCALATSYDTWQAGSFPWTVGWSALGAAGADSGPWLSMVELRWPA
jgi:hypothetical protein